MYNLNVLTYTRENKICHLLKLLQKVTKKFIFSHAMK